MTHRVLPGSTLDQFIAAQDPRDGLDPRELNELLRSLEVACKRIALIVQNADHAATARTGEANIHQEEQIALDLGANNVLRRELELSHHFGLLLSEEDGNVIRTKGATNGSQYVVAFDPLDGSKEVECNIPVGTIFAIWKKTSDGLPAEEDFYQPGRNLVAAGMMIYGPRVQFIYSAGHGVHKFEIDSAGLLVLTDAQVRIPRAGRIYSANEGNSPRWSKHLQDYVLSLKNRTAAQGGAYSARYAGSLVCDVGRLLQKGGVFLYPGDDKNQNGKLRLLYEVIPVAFLIEQAGGIAVTSTGQRILDIVPDDVHQRCTIVAGSPHELKVFQESLQK